MEHVAIFGIQAADQSVPGPERGSAEKVLCDREGWQRRVIPTVADGRHTTIEAMCRGELAVNRMLGGEEGFAICTAATGFRLSYNGSVFARCADAMRAAELMMAASRDWSTVPQRDYSALEVATVREIVSAAERRGEILLDRIYPR